MNAREPRQPLIAAGEIEHHVGDLTATISAQLPLAQVQEKLRQSNQWLPIDGDPQSPVGQLVERNSTGPLRLGYGAWRDLLLGVQFTNGRGELITAGGRTVKNVAGYDLTKFMVGQYGIFGRIVTVTVRTYRRPEGALVAEFPYNEQTIAKLLPTPARPHWAMMHQGRLHCGYLGDRKAMDFYMRIVPQQGGAHLQRHFVEQDIEFRSQRWLTKRPATVFRASVPPARVRDMLAKAPDRSASADGAFGVVVGSCSSESEMTQLEQSTIALGGSIVFDDVKRLSALFEGTSPSAKLLQRLKYAFDPDGRLAPMPTLAPANSAQ